NRKLKRTEGWFSQHPVMVETYEENRLDKFDSNHLVKDISVELLSKELPYLLHSMDRNSMAFGIETRLPFLDHRLVEFSLSLPDDLKIDSFATKKILKESTGKILPVEIVSRSKMGFSTPDATVMRSITPDFWRLNELYDRFPGMFNEKLRQDVD